MFCKGIYIDISSSNKGSSGTTNGKIRKRWWKVWLFYNLNGRKTLPKNKKDEVQNKKGWKPEEEADVWLLPNMFGKNQTRWYIYTWVLFSTHVWILTHMYGKRHTCVKKATQLYVCKCLAFSTHVWEKPLTCLFPPELSVCGDILKPFLGKPHLKIYLILLFFCTKKTSLQNGESENTITY